MTEPVSIRFRNPGALNYAPWMQTFPGFDGHQLTTPGNSTARFKSHEAGVAAWWVLMRKYRDGGHNTVGKIITRYGGTGQDYSAYLATVTARTGFKTNTVIDLDDDAQLITFARAMFRVEAGVESPLTDAQLRIGFALGRNGGKPLDGRPAEPQGEPKRPAPTPTAPSVPEPAPGREKLLWIIFKALWGLLRGK